MKLSGRVALVTGASRGLGLAIAHALAAEGAAIGVLSRPGAELDRAAAALAATGAKVVPLPADVTSDAEVAAAVGTVESRLGGLDILVLNAGTWQATPLGASGEPAWDRLVDLNLKGSFLALEHAAPLLSRRRGSNVVGISSIGGWVGQAGSSVYAASKWGLRGLLESAALELKPHGVRVSILYPHSINSEGKAIAPGSPERDRMLDPGDIASLVAWICAAPPHVAVGNVTIWPIAAGVSFG